MADADRSKRHADARAPSSEDRAEQTAQPARSAAGSRLRSTIAWVRRQRLLREAPAWLTSMAFHIALLVILGLWMLPNLAEAMREIVATTVGDDPAEIEQLALEDPLDPVVIDQEVTQLIDPVSPAELLESIEPTPIEETPAALALAREDFGIELARPSDLLDSAGLFDGRGLEGRGEAARRVLVAQRGGTVASEAAVARSLQWIIEHQQPDGGWSFAHHTCPSCQGQCEDPGVLRGRIAPTALALLPLLGAGQTHLKGKYKQEIRAGLAFLVASMKMTPNGGDLMDDGRMYSHGIATIALCEAYALTEDRDLMPAAQQAINFIVSAQDKAGGGWRYTPGQAGDTSAMGWQLMALKSAHMAYLAFPLETTYGATRFLDSVAAENGATYGYTEPQTRHGTTSVGLLCRMYLGWDRDHEALVRGVEYLSKRGPSRGDFYYNYYATQVLSHYEGELWDKWNKKMRDYLVESQVKEGHASGSWYMPDDHGSRPGGRLYMTALACMTLEVYYRHLPLYRQEAARSEFSPQQRRSK